MGRSIEHEKIRKRAHTINKTLKKLYPNVRIALQYGSHWELLVAVILSAQCTDKKVNEVTSRLFRSYHSIVDYAQVSQQQLENDIHETGFFRTKAKNIRLTAALILEKFEGSVPASMEDLLSLPGVARKTANVVLGNAYDIVEGIAVDTHVKRFAQKFELTFSSDPKIIEQDLMSVFPKSEWFTITYRFIDYGRDLCPARMHDCAEHPLTLLYPKAATLWPKSR